MITKVRWTYLKYDVGSQSTYKQQTAVQNGCILNVLVLSLVVEEVTSMIEKNEDFLLSFSNFVVLLTFRFTSKKNKLILQIVTKLAITSWHSSILSLHMSPRAFLLYKINYYDKCVCKNSKDVIVNNI